MADFRFLVECKMNIDQNDLKYSSTANSTLSIREEHTLKEKIQLKDNEQENKKFKMCNSTKEELEALKTRAQKIEGAIQKLKQLQSAVNKSIGLSFTKDVMDVDSKSIYVGNVDYGTTTKELEDFFRRCGSIKRVSILCDKISGHPKGFAYIEFADLDSVNVAITLDHSLFRGRHIKVMPKRTNRPGMTTGSRNVVGHSSGTRGFSQGSTYFVNRIYRPRSAYKVINKKPY